MESESSRNRIDQFFPSKKRKTESPNTKTGRGEKDAKHSLDGSPNAKGTLDGYLVSSQEDNKVSNLSCFSRNLLPRQDVVKRNLALEIERSSKDVSRYHASSVNSGIQPSEGSQKQPSNSLSNEGDNAIGSPQENDLVSPEQIAGNSEIKKFAVDFLSLYCSEFKQIADSSSEAKAEITSKQRRNDICPDLKDEPDSEGARPGIFRCTGASVFGHSRKVTNGDDAFDSNTVLRRCSSNTPTNFSGVAECHTPGSLAVKECVRETPKSAHGSSMFSPGESFWNEAIQLADGFFAPMVNDCVKVTEVKSIEHDLMYATNSCTLLNYEGNLRKKLDGADHEDQNVETDTAVGLPQEQHKNSVKGVSPLPVKHLDFSSEGNVLEVGAIHDSHQDYLKHATPRCDRDFETMFINGKQDTTSCSAIWTNKMGSVVGAKVSVDAVRNLQLTDHDRRELKSPDMDFQIEKNNHGSNEVCTPSSSLSHINCLNLDSWLPPEISCIYRKRGISRLYPWQVDCLRVDGVLHRRNLVYCASTSAGKSFVAEILMLRRVTSTGKMAILVLPYVSICAEKAEHLELLLEPLGKHVRSYYGNQGGGTLPKDTSVAVCTIEKANSLINRMLEEGRLSEIGIIVIDELHMVGDQHRGYLLELLLTKLRYAAGEGNAESCSGESSGTSSNKADPAHGLQIVGMSATMPNVGAVADWLQAALYQTDFRPVPLEEHIKVGNSIYTKKMELVRTIPKAADLGGKDPDHIVELCNEVVQEGHSVLIFCSSRKGCESTAKHVARFLKRFTVDCHENDSEFKDINSAIDSLRRCPAGLDPILEETFPAGIAFHHAGLTVEEREIVESCYRKGLLRVLTATSTLAAGVNLPARRVIFRQPRIGRDFIDGTRYKQMAGRAGRTGIDTKGESVLICKPEEIKRVSGLMNENCASLHSCLSEDINGMTHAILEVVAGGIVQTANDIHRYVRCTLLNSTKPFQNVVKSAQESLRWLCHRKFLEWNEETKLYSTTPLGRASFGSSLSPEESLVVLDDLSRAREGFVLASDLHLVYLVTPINVDVQPDWELYYQCFMELSPLDHSVGNRVGVTEPFLMRMAHGAPISASIKSRGNTKWLHGEQQCQLGISNGAMSPENQMLRVSKRFYVALILARLVQETPVGEVCEAFKVARGMVQALQENAGRFASMVSVFCERLGWHDLEGLVAKFQNRVSFGVRAEIVELTTIPYVKGSRARALYKAGLRTPQTIAEASIPELVKALFESSSWATEEGSAQRRLHIGLAKKIKNGACKIVLDKAEEARIAAFSAFKSLGYSIPQFNPRILPIVGADSIGKRAGSTSSGSNTAGSNHSTADMKQMEFSLDKPSAMGREKSENIAVEEEAEEMIKPSDVSHVVPAAENSSIVMHHNFPVKNSVLPLGQFGSHEKEPNADLDSAKDVDMSHSSKVKIVGDKTKMHDDCVKNDRYQKEEKVFSSNSSSSHHKGPMNAVNTPGGFDSFLELWGSVQEFFFDIHYNKISGLDSLSPFEMHGMAICWEGSPVYYVNLPKDLWWSGYKRVDLSLEESCNERAIPPPSENDFDIAKERWRRICNIMGKRNIRKITWNLKVQIQILKRPAFSVRRFGRKSAEFELVNNSYLLLFPINVINGIDMGIVAWILWPDEEKSSNPNLEKEVKKRLPPEAVAAANCSGRWKNQTRRAAHNGCCRRVAQIRALYSVLWKLVVSQELFGVLINIEIPLVNVLADMESWGIGVDLEGCIHARKSLVKKLEHLEKEAYKLAGKKFSLSTAADIAKVLFEHLKLPVPEGCNKGKLHLSTDKHCLELLRHEHPIIPVIKEHRTLAKLLNCTLGSICSLARLSTCAQRYTLHGHWLQTSTATGRLSMEEPNLQCVEHMVEFKIKDKERGDAGDVCSAINARDYFVPTQEDRLLVTADYSQIELRLMAHFSKDSYLTELLNKPHGDVFTMIAARWVGCPDEMVEPHLREHTKRMVYGILYGMGPSSLAEQMGCNSDEAAEKIQNFKSSFPGVASWLQETVAKCRQKGYVETLMGRKRFLSKIKLGTSKEKSKAQRQAVNSICQVAELQFPPLVETWTILRIGSAADIIKTAMINIHSVITDDIQNTHPVSSPVTQFSMLRGRCRIVLQVHDELVLEVDSSLIKEAVLLLKVSMEGAASLSVPLLVKLKVGRTWGSLEPLNPDEYGQG